MNGIKTQSLAGGRLNSFCPPPPLTPIVGGRGGVDKFQIFLDRIKGCIPKPFGVDILHKGSHRTGEWGHSNMSHIQEILKKKEERRVKLQRSLDSIVQSLKEMGAQKIILFGSLASGDVDVNSDLDLFVLMPSAKTGKEWTDIIYSTVEKKVASHIIAFNQDEFGKELPTSGFLENIMKGKVLYEKAT